MSLWPHDAGVGIGTGLRVATKQLTLRPGAASGGRLSNCDEAHDVPSSLYHVVVLPAWAPESMRSQRRWAT